MHALIHGGLLTKTTEVFSLCPMNSNQLKRWLEQQGATFTPGKGGHLHVELNGHRSILPMHGSHELGTGLVNTIKKQLGLKGT